MEDAPKKVCLHCGSPVTNDPFSSSLYCCPNCGFTANVQDPPSPPAWWWEFKDDFATDWEESFRHKWKLHRELVQTNRCGYMREDGYCGYPNGEKIATRFVDETCYGCAFYNDPANNLAIQEWIVFYLLNQEKPPSLQALFEGCSLTMNEEQIALAVYSLLKRKEIELYYDRD